MDASEDAQTQALRQKLEQATKDVADTERQIQKTREMLERMEAQIPLYQNQAKDAEGEVPSYTEDLRAMLSVSSVDFKETIKEFRNKYNLREKTLFRNLSRSVEPAEEMTWRERCEKAVQYTETLEREANIQAQRRAQRLESIRVIEDANDCDSATLANRVNTLYTTY